MKKFRKNNKGFTLVELIIVIAILGVLTVAVAPQYLKYVEKSREASDLNAINEVISVMNVVVADPANTALEDGQLKVTVASGVLKVAEDTGSTSGVAAKVAEMIDMPKIQSKDGAKVDLTIEVKLAGKGISITAGSDKLEALRS